LRTGCRGEYLDIRRGRAGEDCIMRNFITCTLHQGEARNAHTILFGKPEGKKPFGRPRRRWK
jgi:hypothetical protein